MDAELTIDDFISHLNEASVDAEKLRKAVPLLKERAQTFGQAREMLSGELSCLFAEPELDRNVLLAKELPDHPGMTILA